MNWKHVVIAVVSLALVVAGVVFFTRQDLGTADQYASVASFFVGLLGLVLTTVSLASQRKPEGHTTNTTINNAQVVQGPRSVAYVNPPTPESDTTPPSE